MFVKRLTTIHEYMDMSTTVICRS